MNSLDELGNILEDKKNAKDGKSIVERKIRRIIRIKHFDTVYDHNEKRVVVYALGDDGVIYHNDDKNNWIALDNIPYDPTMDIKVDDIASGLDELSISKEDNESE